MRMVDDALHLVDSCSGRSGQYEQSQGPSGVTAEGARVHEPPTLGAKRDKATSKHYVNVASLHVDARVIECGVVETAAGAEGASVNRPPRGAESCGRRRRGRRPRGPVEPRDADLRER